jgi:hypothetical protein
MAPMASGSACQARCVVISGDWTSRWVAVRHLVRDPSGLDANAMAWFRGPNSSKWRCATRMWPPPGLSSAPRSPASSHARTPDRGSPHNLETGPQRPDTQLRGQQREQEQRNPSGDVHRPRGRPEARAPITSPRTMATCSFASRLFHDLCRVAPDRAGGARPVPEGLTPPRAAPSPVGSRPASSARASTTTSREDASAKTRPAHEHS